MTATLASTTPDLTTYRLVHRAIRAGARDLAAATATLDPTDRRRATAVSRWGAGYLGELHAHHTIEDATFFPSLVRRVDAAGDLIVRSDRDHAELDDLIGRLDPLFVALGKGAIDPTAPDGLAPTLARLSALMTEHLDFEDAEVLPLFEQHYTAEEYAVMNEAAVKSLGLGKQAAFTVPFLLSVVRPEEHDAVWSDAPTPMKVLFHLTRGGYARRSALAFGTAA